MTSLGDLPRVNKIHVHRLLYSDGSVWIGTWANGAICYNPKTGVYTQYTYKPEDTEKLFPTEIFIRWFLWETDGI